ncbi:peptidase S24, partial [Myxococcus sp. AM001]|nr:peptidase S24 [Myxococcus sp. AM001]
MATAVFFAPLGSSAIDLPFFSFRIPAGFPSPAQDHLEQKLSLDELLDIDAPHTYLVR